MVTVLVHTQTYLYLDSFIRSGTYGGNNYGRETALEIKDTAVRSDFTRYSRIFYEDS